MKHINILEGFYRDVWGAGDIAAINLYFDPEAMSAGIDRGYAFRIEDMMAFIEAMHGLVEEVEFEITRAITDGDWTAAVAEMRCIDRSSGRPMQLTTQCMMRFQDGRIAEAHNTFDTLSFFEQLGLVPEDLKLRLLAGEIIS